MRHLAILTIFLILAGCSGGGAGVRFFIIDPVQNTVLWDASGSQLAIEVMDLQVPQYLERPRIASRTGDNQLVFSQGNQWGDNLRKNLARTLARNLSRSLSTPDVSSPYNRSTTRPDYRVLVHMEEFEQGADGRVRVAARWQIIAGSTGQTLVTEQALLVSDVAYGAQEYDAVVGALQGLFGGLSLRIAESIIVQMERP